MSLKFLQKIISMSGACAVQNNLNKEVVYGDDIGIICHKKCHLYPIGTFLSYIFLLLLLVFRYKIQHTTESGCIRMKHDYLYVGSHNLNFTLSSKFIFPSMGLRTQHASPIFW